MTRVQVLAAVGLLVISSADARAQDAAPPAPRTPAAPAAPAPPAPGVGAASIVPLKVTITLSKYQGDKKVSSLPYELTVRTDNNKASIRMTTQVPALIVDPAADPGKPRTGPFVMRDVGTNIDCNATNLKDGRYSVTVTIEDSSIYEDSQRTDIPNGSKASGASAWRTYRTTNALVLRDGQSTEFTTAVDKITGDVFKANVLLTVIK